VSFRRLTASVVFLAVFTMAVRASADTDTWWHLRAGAWMVEHRQILSQDVFSLTRMGQPWVNPGWLAEITLYGAFATLGFAGLNLLTALIVLAAFIFLWHTLEGPVLWRGFVMILVAATSGVFWSARPQIFSFALAGAYLWILERTHSGDRRLLWVLPPLMALWVNLHGGFAIGFILLGIYLGGALVEMAVRPLIGAASLRAAWESSSSRVLSLAGVGLVCAVAVCLNPHGPALLGYPFKTVSIGVLRDYIQEWQSPDFHSLEAQPFLWMLFLTVGALALTRRGRAATDLLLPFALGYLGFMAGRNIALFALGSAPVLSRHGCSALEPVLARIRRGPAVPERIARVMNVVILVLILTASVAKLTIPLSVEVNREALRAQLPVAAIEWVDQNRPTGPLFNSYNWGGYLLWALYPDYLTFVDGRTDLFDDAILNEYLHAWRADPGWQQVFEHWGIRLALLEPDSPLAHALVCAGWNPLYSDEQAVVLGEPEGR
jgi:hypothetical protein